MSNFTEEQTLAIIEAIAENPRVMQALYRIILPMITKRNLELGLIEISHSNVVPIDKKKGGE